MATRFWTARFWIALAALAVATACSGPAQQPAEAPKAVEAPPAETQVYLGELASSFQPPPPIPSGTALLAGLSAGQSAKLMIDPCPKADDDTLQSLICGETYTVFWQPQERRWGLIGPNETLRKQKAKNSLTAGLYAGGYPPESQLIIAWGLPLTIDDSGAVKQEGRVIGRLETAN